MKITKVQPKPPAPVYTIEGLEWWQMIILKHAMQRMSEEFTPESKPREFCQKLVTSIQEVIR